MPSTYGRSFSMTQSCIVLKSYVMWNLLELNRIRDKIAQARTHTQRLMNATWSEMVSSTPCIALYCLCSPWLVQYGRNSPTIDQPCRLIITLLLLVLHFYDDEQYNAAPSTKLRNEGRNCVVPMIQHTIQMINSGSHYLNQQST